MSGYLLDTNHLSAALDKVSMLRDRIRRQSRKGTRFWTCWPVLCELEVGIVNTNDPVRNRRVLHELMKTVIVWPQDWKVVREYGEISKSLRECGRVLSPADITLVAFARIRNATVLTTDLDFEATPEIRTENWLV